jgi:ABC-type lipoprotein export system ATPase subunit
MASDIKIQNIILESLRFPTMRDRYEDIEDAHAETFKLIFQEAGYEDKPWDNFSRWLRSGDSIYWISGKAGSGKSTLMR